MNTFPFIYIVFSLIALGSCSPQKVISSVPEIRHAKGNIGAIVDTNSPPLFSHRGRTLSTDATRLKVGVPKNSVFKQFVNVPTDPTDQHAYTGFSIEVFKETMRNLPYDLKYDFLPFEGLYDELVMEVNKTNFDAAAGDITILANRTELVDFTQPYTESGLEMIVTVRSKMDDKAWLFVKPFTKFMWIAIVGVTIFNGFVIFLVEREHNHELTELSVSDQIGTVFWQAFSTLFSLHGERLHSNLSRMAMVVWLFVALIVTQSYTASLTSMLTAQKLEPRISSFETLRKNGEAVGYCRASFVGTYLQDILDFKPNQILKFDTTEEYAKALKNGQIGALFLEVPAAKLFLAQYCKSFIRAGETFKVGGFGFAFSKGFPGLSNINKALLNVSEGSKYRELENRFIGSEKCLDLDSSYNENGNLSLESFWILFVLTGGTSTVAFIFYTIIVLKRYYNSIPEEHRSIFKMIMAAAKHLRQRRRQFSARVGNVESPQNPPDPPDPWDQV